MTAYQTDHDRAPPGIAEDRPHFRREFLQLAVCARTDLMSPDQVRKAIRICSAVFLLSSSLMSSRMTSAGVLRYRCQNIQLGGPVFLIMQQADCTFTSHIDISTRFSAISIACFSSFVRMSEFVLATSKIRILYPTSQLRAAIAG
jgi:hypothetical protein